MKKKILFKIFFSLIIFVIFLFIYKNYKSSDIQVQKYETVCGEYKKVEVEIGTNLLSVDIADNNCKRELGLSNRISIKSEGGMIFIFEKAGNYGFWMKDMNFPIDILWINDDFNVVGIEKDVSTSTYPKSFGEGYSAKYVLELSAGYSDKNNIKVGNKIFFRKIQEKIRF